MSKITQKDIALGKKIQRLRKRAGFTQEEVAEKTRLTQTHISLIETGNRRASMDTLKKVASVIGVKVRDLIPF